MKTKYLMSMDDATKLPLFKHQIAFTGRSNVGKSSLINAITQTTNLCKTSKTPGRTQKINYFEVEKYTFVDLPGYGFAKVPIEFRHKWDALMQTYFDNNENLAKVFLLIDARRGIMESDMLMKSMIEQYSYNIILTKCDKVNNAIYQKEEIQDRLGVLVYLTSVAKKTGLTELRQYLFTK